MWGGKIARNMRPGQEISEVFELGGGKRFWNVMIFEEGMWRGGVVIIVLL